MRLWQWPDWLGELEFGDAYGMTFQAGCCITGECKAAGNGGLSVS